MATNDVTAMLEELRGNAPLTDTRRAEIAEALETYAEGFKKADDTLMSVDYMLNDWMWADDKRIPGASKEVFDYAVARDESPALHEASGLV